jgi:hypothetical protein
VARRSDPSSSGPGRPGGRGLVLVEYACPACAALLDLETGRSDDPPLRDSVLRWPVASLEP